jgi:hypothetical protein
VICSRLLVRRGAHSLANAITIALAAILTVAGCGGASRPASSGALETAVDSPVSPSASKARLPMEVLGPPGHMASTQFNVAAAPGGTYRLWLQCHRCGWRDGSVQSGKDRGAKASVRLNGGRWQDITDANVDMGAAEQAYGGLSGGFHTTRFSLGVDNVASGVNTVEFRFNTDDGISNGFRIVGMNLIDPAGTWLLGSDDFEHEDPSQWQVEGSSEDVAQGRALWNGSVALRESPLSSRMLKATCANCHAADGRDLKYFNYSSRSIRARSEFHGLGEQQGRQIAAYVRSLNVSAPSQARPWNPPYQPGPGLDSKPVQEWAAGAGVDAVLNSDKEMLAQLFAQGTSADAVSKVIDIKSTLNVRELRVPLQLPDWNDWLPHVHPLDVWGDAFADSDAAAVEQQVKSALSTATEERINDRLVVSDIEALMRRTLERDVSADGRAGAVPGVCESARGRHRRGVADGPPAARQQL